MFIAFLPQDSRHTVVKPGRVLFEMGGVNPVIAREAMRLAGHKLPIKTKFVIKGQELGGE